MQSENRSALACGLIYLLAGAGCLFASIQVLTPDPGSLPLAAAEGQILARYHAPSVEGGRIAYVDYRFTPAGDATITVSQAVPHDSWASLAPGSSVAITYPPHDPQRGATLAGIQAPRGTAVFVLLAGILFLLGGLVTLAEALGLPHRAAPQLAVPLGQ